MINRAEALTIELQYVVRSFFRSGTETFSVRLRKLFPHASEYFSVGFGKIVRSVTENFSELYPLWFGRFFVTLQHTSRRRNSH